MKKYYFLFSEGSNINQVICALLVNLPSFAYGASIGWMSPMTLLLQSKNSPRGTPLSDYEISLLGSMPYLSCLPGGVLITMIADRFGRKYALCITSSMGFGCWVIKLLSTETWAFVIARGMVGCLMAGTYITCPVYTKEISANSVRGMFGSLVTLFQTTGNLFLYIIGDFLSYHNILWVCLSLPAIHLLLFTMMPESPSYFVRKGDLDRAKSALAWLRCRKEDDAVVLQELNQIKKEQNKDDENNNFAIKAIFSDKILRRAFAIALVVALSRELCGTIPISNFAGDIFTLSSKGTSLSLSPNQQAMMLGAVQVFGSILTLGVVEKSGRKMLLLLTSLISGLSMVALASWFLARTFNIHGAAWLPIVTLCLSIFCDSFGLQPVSVIIVSEIFSFKYRGTVMATVMCSASFTSFLQMLFFKPIVNLLGVYVTFYGFGGVCLFTALYTMLVVPETKMRNLEEIYEDLKAKKEKKMGANISCEIK